MNNVDIYTTGQQPRSACCLRAVPYKRETVHRITQNNTVRTGERDEFISMLLFMLAPGRTKGIRLSTPDL